jgi:hypothetical protein
MGEERVEPGTSTCESDRLRDQDAARGSAEYCLSRCRNINQRVCGEGKAAHGGVRRHRIFGVWLKPAIWKPCGHKSNSRLCPRRLFLDRFLFVHRDNRRINRRTSLLPAAVRNLIHSR